MEVLGLDFRYDNGYKVFNNINIKVERGKFAAIVGPSGVMYFSPHFLSASITGLISLPDSVSEYRTTTG